MKLRDRRQTLSLMVGLAVGITLTGLALPFVAGDRVEQVAASGPLEIGPAGQTSSGDTTAATTTVVPGDVTTAGPGATTPGRTTSGPVASASNPEPVATTGETGPGVFDDRIKIGFALIDLGGAGRLGVAVPGADADSQRRAYQAFVDEVNESGGVNGRKIEPVYRSYDPVNEDAQRATCTALTEDDKVFAVIALGLFGPTVLCITEQHGTVLLNGDGFSDEYYRRSRGLAFTNIPGKSRTFRNQVARLHEMGLLKGKKLGVLTAEIGEDNVAVDEGLVPTLAHYGYELTHYSKLGNDLGTAQAQIPVEVRQMQGKGVELVFFGTNVVFSTNFAQQADSQGFRPGYLTNDFGNMTSDFFVSNMPASFKGIGITFARTGEWRVGQPEPAPDADCRASFTRHSGVTPERESTDATYSLAMTACNQVRLMARGLVGAGGNLTSSGLSAALQGLGEFEMANTPGGSFRTGKFDAPDFVRPAGADMACRCWKPTGPFQPARF